MVERTKLTDTQVQKYQAGSKRRRIWDTSQPGFLLQIETPSPSHPYGFRSFKFHYRYGGRDRWYSIGPSKFNRHSRNALDVKTARGIAAEVATAVNRGDDPHGAKIQERQQVERDAVTFKDLFEKYMERHAKRKLKSWKQVDSNLRRYVLPELGRRNADSIERKDARRLHDKLTTERGASTAELVLSQFSAVFTWAIRHEEVTLAAHPVKNLERNTLASRSRVVTDRLFPSLCGQLESTGLFRARALMMVLYTGQRPGEVRAMRHQDIEWVDGGAWWYLPGAADKTWPGTKNGRDNRIWLSEPALAIVTELQQEPGPYVFSDDSRLPALDSAMKTVCRKAGIVTDDMDATTYRSSKVVPLDLLRSCVMPLARDGCSREQVDRILNHAPSTGDETTDVYIRYRYEKETRAAMESLAFRIQRLAAGYKFETEGEQGKVVNLKAHANC